MRIAPLVLLIIAACKTGTAIDIGVPTVANVPSVQCKAVTSKVTVDVIAIPSRPSAYHLIAADGSFLDVTPIDYASVQPPTQTLRCGNWQKGATQ